mgnify:CR=1 FL=1
MTRVGNVVQFTVSASDQARTAGAATPALDPRLVNPMRSLTAVGNKQCLFQAAGASFQVEEPISGDCQFQTPFTPIDVKLSCESANGVTQTSVTGVRPAQGLLLSGDASTQLQVLAGDPQVLVCNGEAVTKSRDSEVNNSPTNSGAIGFPVEPRKPEKPRKPTKPFENNGNNDTRTSSSTSQLSPTLGQNKPQSGFAFTPQPAVDGRDNTTVVNAPAPAPRASHGSKSMSMSSALTVGVVAVSLLAINSL